MYEIVDSVNTEGFQKIEKHFHFKREEPDKNIAPHNRKKRTKGFNKFKYFIAKIEASFVCISHKKNS